MSTRPLIPPAVIRISGADWSCVPARFDDRYGQASDATKTISIDYGQCNGPFNTADTVLHEVMHAVLRQQGRPYTEDEEVFVRALATGLTGVFSDNPALLRYLAKALS